MWAAIKGWPKWAQWTAGIFVALLIIGLAAGPEDDDEQTVATQTQTPTAPAGESASTSPPESAPPATAAPVTPAPDPGAKLKAAIAKELGSGRKGVPRLGDVYVSEDIVSVSWAIAENITEGLTKDTARREAVQIIETVKKQGLNYRQLNLIGSYELVDQLGNSSEKTVVRASYPKTTVDRINFSGFDFKNAFVVADTAIIHPSFEY